MAKRKPLKHRDVAAHALEGLVFRNRVLPNKKKAKNKLLSRKVVHASADDDIMT